MKPFLLAFMFFALTAEAQDFEPLPLTKAEIKVM
jgi:hypothetical protein